MSIQNENAAAPDIVWGAEAIAPYLGKTTRGAFHAMERGRIPGAAKIGGRWGLNLRLFYAAFAEKAAA